jgi:membrane protease YdiL (CAAX protease family)
MNVSVLPSSACTACSVAEENLFRGFLLSAILERMGRIDAVLLTGVLFSSAHLDLQQFFGLSMMGMAAGGVALRSGSVLPAIALHLGYNLTALAAGAMLPLSQ